MVTSAHMKSPLNFIIEFCNKIFVINIIKKNLINSIDLYRLIDSNCSKSFQLLIYVVLIFNKATSIIYMKKTMKILFKMEKFIFNFLIKINVADEIINVSTHKFSKKL